jgi:hypothetical protein
MSAGIRPDNPLRVGDAIGVLFMGTRTCGNSVRLVRAATSWKGRAARAFFEVLPAKVNSQLHRVAEVGPSSRRNEQLANPKSKAEACRGGRVTADCDESPLFGDHPPTKPLD